VHSFPACWDLNRIRMLNALAAENLDRNKTEIIRENSRGSAPIATLCQNTAIVLTMVPQHAIRSSPKHVHDGERYVSTTAPGR
jgi:hypothetical protein